MSEVNRIIQDLEFCDSVFDYTLTPDDSGLLLGYIQELQQENQQLKDRNKLLEKHYKQGEKNLGIQIDITLKYEKVLDEIREFIKKCSFSIEGLTNEYHDIVYAEDIEEILDKVKE